MKISRLLVFVAVALSFGFATPSWAGRFPGGKGKADCYSEFEVTNVATAKSVLCMDNDPVCDTDTTCGQCTIGVALCLNQTDPNDPKCTPHPPLTSVTVDTGQPLNVPDLSSTACGTSTGVVVPLRTTKKGKQKPGMTKIKVTALSSIKPKQDKDTLKIKCTPNPLCSTPGSTTTTTMPPPPPSCTGANTAGGPDEIDLVVASTSTDLDSGWTGVSHNFPVTPNSTLRACLKTCGPDGTPPCDMTAAVGAGTPNGATFGAPLPLLAANVPVCVVNEWNGSPNGIGTVDPITGEANFQINLTSKVHLTTSTQVCPRCNNNKCDSGPKTGQACTVDATLRVAQSLGANKNYNLSRDCPPDPGTLAAPLDIRLASTTETATKVGPKPCTAQAGEPTGVPVQDDNCGSGGCGSNNCSGSACATMGTDPSSGNPICIDSKGGLSQNCCNNDTTRSCFPTAGGGSITRTGKPSIPSPAFPDQTYPKTGNGVVVSIFCIPATGTNSIDTTSGLPGPGALVTPGTQTWIK